MISSLSSLNLFLYFEEAFKVTHLGLFLDGRVISLVCREPISSFTLIKSTFVLLLIVVTFGFHLLGRYLNIFLITFNQEIISPKCQELWITPFLVPGSRRVHAYAQAFINQLQWNKMTIKTIINYASRDVALIPMICMFLGQNPFDKDETCNLQRYHTPKIFRSMTRIMILALQSADFGRMETQALSLSLFFSL